MDTDVSSWLKALPGKDLVPFNVVIACFLFFSSLSYSISTIPVDVHYFNFFDVLLLCIVINVFSKF